MDRLSAMRKSDAGCAGHTISVDRECPGARQLRCWENWTARAFPITTFELIAARFGRRIALCAEYILCEETSLPMANSKSPCSCGGVSSARSDLGGVAGAVNSACHGFVGGVSGHQKHVVPNPQAVLICWDQYFANTAAAVSSMDQFVSDQATGG